MKLKFEATWVLYANQGNQNFLPAFSELTYDLSTPKLILIYRKINYVQLSVLANVLSTHKAPISF